MTQPPTGTPSDTPRFYHDPDGRKMAARELRIDAVVQQRKKEGIDDARRVAEMVADQEHTAPMTTPRKEMYAHTGFASPPVESLDEDALEPLIDRVTNELHGMQITVDCVDDLTPRQLYAYIQDEVLDCELPDIPMSLHCWEHFTGPMDLDELEDDFDDD